MAALAQSTRRKLSLLHLAQELQNVAKACRIMGYHRDTFYEVRRAFQVGGVAALVEQRRGPRGPHPNRVAEEVETKILAYALDHPTHGAQRVANELRLQGAKVYTSKMPLTACDVLYDRVLPFYETLGVPISAVLTDNGREFCGRPESHPYELLLGMEGIEHRTTRVHTPRTNGFVERMNRTLLDECFRVAGRTTWYL